MEIEETNRDGVTILRISGAMMSGADVNGFQDRIRHLAAGGEVRVVVDLSGVAWFGSAMLGVLASSLMILEESDGQIRLAAAPEKVKTIFKVTHLDRVFAFDDTADEAVMKLR